MKRYTNSFAVILLTAITVYGCTGGSGSNKQVAVSQPVQNVPDPEIGQESRLLLKELEDNGDYVNSLEFPSLIKASLVYEALNEKNLIVDIRPASAWKEGHIKGSVSKQFSDLPSWLESGIRPFEYEKIIIVCDDGQLASYTAALLRLKGYGNVFAMRWGMSGWNRKFAAGGWLSGLSGKYENQIDTVTHEKPLPVALPQLATGQTQGSAVADARFAALFREGTGSVLISADEVFANPSEYFVINLERKDKYENGHIPGAVRYKPDATLGFPGEMATIPAGKTVVLYCGTGHNSAFASAYLRMFGYDARTLKYGNNSFMYEKMKRDRTSLSWLPFSEADINDFPYMK